MNAKIRSTISLAFITQMTTRVNMPASSRRGRENKLGVVNTSRNETQWNDGVQRGTSVIALRSIPAVVNAH